MRGNISSTFLCFLLLLKGLHCFITAFCLALHFVLNRDIQIHGLSKDGNPRTGLEICSFIVMTILKNKQYVIKWQLYMTLTLAASPLHVCYLSAD